MGNQNTKKSQDFTITIAQFNILNADLSKNPSEYLDPIQQTDQFTEMIGKLKQPNFLADPEHKWWFLTTMTFTCADVLLNPKALSEYQDFKVDKDDATAQPNFLPLRQNLDWLQLLNYDDKTADKIRSQLCQIYNSKKINYDDTNNTKFVSSEDDLAKKTDFRYWSVPQKVVRSGKETTVYSQFMRFLNNEQGEKQLDQNKLSRLESQHKQQDNAFYHQNEFADQTQESKFQLLLAQEDDFNPAQVLAESGDDPKEVNARLVYQLYDLMRRKVIVLCLLLLNSHDFDFQGRMMELLPDNLEEMQGPEALELFVKASQATFNSQDQPVNLHHLLCSDETDLRQVLFNEKSSLRIEFINQLNYINEQHGESISNSQRLDKLLQQSKFDTRKDSVDILILNEVNKGMQAHMARQDGSKFKLQPEKQPEAHPFITCAVLCPHFAEQQALTQIAPVNFSHKTHSNEWRNFVIQLEHKVTRVKLWFYCLHLDSDEKNKVQRLEIAHQIVDELKTESIKGNLVKFVIAGDINEEFYNVKQGVESVHSVLHQLFEDVQSFEAVARNFKNMQTTCKNRSAMQTQISKIHKQDKQFKDIIVSNGDCSECLQEKYFQFVKKLNFSDHALIKLKQGFYV